MVSLFLEFQCVLKMNGWIKRNINIIGSGERGISGVLHALRRKWMVFVAIARQPQNVLIFHVLGKPSVVLNSHFSLHVPFPVLSGDGD